MAAEVEIVGTFTDNASGGLSGFAGTLGNLSNIVTGIKSAFDLVGGAIDAAVGFLQPFVGSASESEQAIARLEGVLRATGGAAGFTSAQLQYMADSLQNTTRFSDETILAGEALLLTFRNISGETFERTVPAMVDMAEIFGSVDSAAMQLGKALNDPLTGMGALSRAGITFSDTQKEMIKNFVETNDLAAAQNIILTEVENQVKGLAETMGTTFSGQVAIFQNHLDSIREVLGGALLPALTELLSKFNEFLSRPEVFEYFAKLSMNIAEVANNFGKLAQMVGYLLVGDMDSLLDIFVKMGAEGIPGMREFSDLLVSLDDLDPSTALDIILQFFENLTGIDLGGAVDTITRFFDTLKTEGLGPAIAGLFDGVDIGASLQSLVDELANRLDQINWTPIAQTISDVIIMSVELALQGLDLVVNRIDWTPLGNAAKGALREIWNGLTESTNSFDWGSIGHSIMDAIGTVFLYTPIGQLTKWVHDMIAKVKEILGIASPSTVFFGIAEDIVKGLIGGFEFFWEDLITVAKRSLQEFMDLFGIDISFGGSGTLGGGVATHSGPGGTGTSGGGSGTGAPGTGTSGQVVTINNYGPSYWGVGGPGDVSGVYDCPSPNPFVDASTGVVGGLGGGAVGGRVGGR